MIFDMYDSFSRAGKYFRKSIMGNGIVHKPVPHFPPISKQMTKILDDANKKAQLYHELKLKPRSASVFSNSVRNQGYINSEALKTPGVGKYEPKLSAIKKKMACLLDYNKEPTKPRMPPKSHSFCHQDEYSCSYDIRKAVHDYVLVRDEKKDYKLYPFQDKLSGVVYRKRISLSSEKSAKDGISGISVQGSKEKKDVNHSRKLDEKKFILKKVLNGHKISNVLNEIQKSKIENPENHEAYKLASLNEKNETLYLTSQENFIKKANVVFGKIWHNQEEKSIPSSILNQMNDKSKKMVKSNYLNQSFKQSRKNHSMHENLNSHAHESSVHEESIIASDKKRSRFLESQTRNRNHLQNQKKLTLLKLQSFFNEQSLKMLTV